MQLSASGSGPLWLALVPAFNGGLCSSKRMGQDWRPNQAVLSVRIMHHLLEKTEGRAISSDIPSDRERWIFAGTYFCICFVLSLRSSEGLMADLEGAKKYMDEESDLVVVPLLGRFKGEHHSKQHLLTSVAVTGSGIQVKRWMELSLLAHSIAGRTKGPLFVNVKGDELKTSDMNELFQEVICEIYDDNPKLFGIDITGVAELINKFNVFRSSRRGSESRATAMKVSEADSYVVNR